MRPLFLNSAVDATNKAAHGGSCINMYPETVPQGGRSQRVLRTVVGEQTFADLGTPLVREMAVANNELYAVANGRLFRVNEDGTHDDLGAVTDGDFATISGNLDTVAVTSGGAYHVYDGTAVTQHTGYLESAGLEVGSAAFHNYKTIRTGLNADYWDWSNLADPKTLPILNQKRGEANPDDVLRVMVDGNYVLIMGESAIEVWADSGNANEGAYTTRLRVIEQGCKSAKLMCKPDTGVFFVGDDNQCYMLTSGGVRPLVHQGVTRDVKNGRPDRCFYYEDLGHKFCVVRFHDRPAWVYDIAMDDWHERASGVDLGPWDIVATAFAYGKLFGARNTGEIHELAHTGTDVGQPLKRSIVSLPFYNDGERFRVPMLEILGELGTIKNDVEVMLEFSRDNGRTWRDPIVRRLNTLADYEALVRWRNLGQFRQFTARISVTDVSDLTLYSEGNMRVA